MTESKITPEKASNSSYEYRNMSIVAKDLFILAKTERKFKNSKL